MHGMPRLKKNRKKKEKLKEKGNDHIWWKALVTTQY
jgi:hypothetical protein